MAMERANANNGCGTNYNGRVDPTNENYFKSDDKAGGPTDPTTGFQDIAKVIYEGCDTTDPKL